MSSKNKRLEKIFNNKGIRGWLKPVDNLESSHFVIVENKKCIYDSWLLTTEHYKILLERGETYPPEIVHFLINTNKRNVEKTNKSILPRRIMGLFKV